MLVSERSRKRKLEQKKESSYNIWDRIKIAKKRFDLLKQEYEDKLYNKPRIGNYHHPVPTGDRPLNKFLASVQAGITMLKGTPKDLPTVAKNESTNPKNLAELKTRKAVIENIENKKYILSTIPGIDEITQDFILKDENLMSRDGISFRQYLELNKSYIKACARSAIEEKEFPNLAEIRRLKKALEAVDTIISETNLIARANAWILLKEDRSLPVYSPLHMVSIDRKTEVVPMDYHLISSTNTTRALEQKAAIIGLIDGVVKPLEMFRVTYQKQPTQPSDLYYDVDASIEKYRNSLVTKIDSLTLNRQQI
ncbi:MAG: hypothetical protein OHK0017_10700 [Patescibacteria group bacterium]